MRMWTYTLRELFRRPGRTLLTLTGIVIGVASIMAITITSQATRLAARDLFASVTGKAELEVVADGLDGFTPDMVESLKTVPGIVSAVPLVRVAGAIVGKSGPVPVLVLGIDPDLDRQIRDYAVQTGSFLDEATGLLLPANLADAQGLAVGQTTRLMTPSGLTTLPVAGTLEPRGAAAFNGGSVAFLRLDQAQKLFGLEDQINNVQLVLAEGADVDEVAKAVEERLPPGLSVQAPAVRGDAVRETLHSTEQGLATLSLVSLVAGAFVILNTFLMNLGERQKQLAILRSLGATRSQVTGLLLREAALLGLTGTLLGTGAGWLLAQVLRRVMMQIARLNLADLRVSWEPFVLALLIGPAMALAATWLPARAAGRRPPLEGLQAKRGGTSARLPAWAVWLGIALALVTSLYVGVLVAGWLPPAVNTLLLGPTLALGMVGGVLSLPPLLGWLTPAVARLLSPLLGVEGRLAFRQLERQPVRTLLTVGVLYVGVAVSLGFGNSLLNNIRKIHDWYHKTIICDFLVRGTMPDAAFSVVATLPESLAPDVAAVPGVARADPISFVIGRVRKGEAEPKRAIVLGRTFTEGQPLRMDLADGEREGLVAKLNQGEVVIGTVLAQRLGARVGDVIILETGKGPKPVRVAATVTEYTLGGMAIYMQWRVAKEVFAFNGVHSFEVTAEPGRVEEARQNLEAFCRDRGLMLQTNAELLGVVQAMIDGVEGFLYALIALLFVVASLGVVNTLTMNVLEQTRELGVLRAVGLKRSQARKMVLSQALLLAVVSLIPGVLAGLFLAVLMNLATEPVIGQRVPFQLDVVYLGVCVGAVLVVALLAGLLPARRAARLPVIEALHYE